MDSWMGNISWRSQASSEDTDSSLQGDLDEDAGKENFSNHSVSGACKTEKAVLLCV